jgi:hypothetical protein
MSACWDMAQLLFDIEERQVASDNESGQNYTITRLLLLLILLGTLIDILKISKKMCSTLLKLTPVRRICIEMYEVQFLPMIITSKDLRDLLKTSPR